MSHINQQTCLVEYVFERDVLNIQVREDYGIYSTLNHSATGTRARSIALYRLQTSCS